MLTNSEKLDLVKLYYASNSARKTVASFLTKHPNHAPVSHREVLRVVSKLNSTYSLKDGRKGGNTKGKRRITENETNVLALIENNPELTLKEISEQLNISTTAVYKILKRNDYKSYHFSKHQQLELGDHERRIFFCTDMMEGLNQDREMVKNICFTDESSFTLKKVPNRQNSRIWSRLNPHRVVRTHTQYPQRINVWAGILGYKIIGPIFYQYTLNGERFLDLLQNEISKLIREEAEGREVWVPAHMFREVKSFLRNAFPGKVIAKGCDIDYSPRSPDIAPNKKKTVLFAKKTVT